MVAPLIKALLIGLAAYRAAKMLTMEDGPFNVFEKLRDWIFTRFDEYSWVNKGFSCPLCVSFWLALAFIFLPTPVLIWLAAAAIASVIFTMEFK